MHDRKNVRKYYNFMNMTISNPYQIGENEVNSARIVLAACMGVIPADA